jgi:hypothetical protein
MTSDTSTALEERIEVAAPAAEAFDAVTNVHRMARRSPECFAIWVLRKRNGMPAQFIGGNRNGFHVWFSSCQVRVADQRGTGAHVLGRIFIGKAIDDRRVEVNRDGMRKSLRRFKAELESER